MCKVFSNFLVILLWSLCHLYLSTTFRFNLHMVVWVDIVFTDNLPKIITRWRAYSFFILSVERDQCALKWQLKIFS